MARIADTERVLRLLRESEGGSLARREIVESLGLSDDRYKEVVALLGDRVETNRGRLGGLRLSGHPRGGAGANEARAPAAVPEPLERDFYAPFKKYLQHAARELDASKSVALETYKTKRGKWGTPDLVELRVTPFPMIGQWELIVIAYELKRQDAWKVDSVLQTAAYAEFAHESWLVIPAGDDGDWTEYFGERIVEKAGEFGIGLATFDADASAMQKHTRPKRRQPTLSRQNEWLETIIERLERLGMPDLNPSIGDNIQWASRKAKAFVDAGCSIGERLLALYAVVSALRALW